MKNPAMKRLLTFFLVALPLLLKNLDMPAEANKAAEEDAARIVTAEAAIQAIERHQHDLAETHGHAERYAEAGARVMDLYRERIEALGAAEADSLRAQGALFRDFRMVGVAAERAALLTLLRSRKIGSEVGRKLTRELDLSEARLRA